MVSHKNTSEDKAVKRREGRKGFPISMPSTMIVFIVLVYVTILLLVTLDLRPRDDSCDRFMVSFGTKEVQGPTSATIDFGKITCDPSPTKLKIVLVVNGTVQGNYDFQSNEDGGLLLTWGANVGNLTYEDAADNGRVNIGDRLVLTDLRPGSDYVIYLIIAFTGDLITSDSFSTPAG
ncbi:MAG: hypothetical protein KAW09_11050 [Thermoplasmata archaeon]|nr:hypothetical protein [Thermoplasmata archaeon]